MDGSGRLRRHEIVLKLEHLRHVAERVSGLGIDLNTHQVISRTVDEISVGIDLKIAAAGIVGDACEHRHIVGDPACLLHREESVAVDRHVSGDRRRRDRSLRGNGGACVGCDGSRDLPVRRRRIRNEVDKTGAYALVTGGLRVRDVAGDVLEGEGLRLQTRNGSIESIKDTHSIVSKFDPDGPPI